MAPTATARLASGTVSRVLPFALPQLHVGTDICHVARVYAILTKPPSSTTTTPKYTIASRFIKRVLTSHEVDALGPALPTITTTMESTMSAHAAVAWLAQGGDLSASPPSQKQNTDDRDPPVWRAAQFLAGRFAAKEAVIKAHPHLRGLTLQDVRIARQHEGDLARNGSGPPLAFVKVLPKNANADNGNQKVFEQEARLSISHDGEYATAVCLGVEHTL